MGTRASPTGTNRPSTKAAPSAYDVRSAAAACSITSPLSTPIPHRQYSSRRVAHQRYTGLSEGERRRGCYAGSGTVSRDSQRSVVLDNTGLAFHTTLSFVGGKVTAQEVTLQEA